MLPRWRNKGHCRLATATLRSFRGGNLNSDHPVLSLSPRATTLLQEQQSEHKGRVRGALPHDCITDRLVIDIHLLLVELRAHRGSKCSYLFTIREFETGKQTVKPCGASGRPRGRVSRGLNFGEPGKRGARGRICGRLSTQQMRTASIVIEQPLGKHWWISWICS